MSSFTLKSIAIAAASMAFGILLKKREHDVKGKFVKHKKYLGKY
jgi:hypothetical protein